MSPSPRSRTAAKSASGRSAAKERAQTRTLKEPATLRDTLSAMLAGAGAKRIQQLLKHKSIAVNGAVVTRGDTELGVGDVVTVHFEGAAPRTRELAGGLKVIYEDEHIIVIDKPPGLLTIATEHERERTAYAMLMSYVRERDAEARVFIVHRLDKGTSGLLVFARSEAVKRTLQDQWRTVEKKYLAVVEGLPSPAEGTLRSNLRENKGLEVYATAEGEGGGVPAVTHYRVVKPGAHFSLLEVVLETGRKNQIRVQLSDAGHPISGDRKYGAKPAGRLGLHASLLTLEHPVRGERLTFKSPLPAALKQLPG